MILNIFILMMNFYKPSSMARYCGLWEVGNGGVGEYISRLYQIP